MLVSCALPLRAPFALPLRCLPRVPSSPSNRALQQSFLDWFSPGESRHPVFGQVQSGMDVVTRISKVQTSNDNPITPIMMKSITISGLKKDERKRLKSGASTASPEL